jgi:hypothetical protein
MENSPDCTSSASIPGYRAVSEDSQQSRKTVDLLHGASSSPDLNTRPPLPTLELANISLSRTRTLPSRSPKHAPSIVPTLQGITFEGENLERLRRWVLGLAIGNYCLLVQLYILSTYLLQSFFQLISTLSKVPRYAAYFHSCHCTRSRLKTCSFYLFPILSLLK